MAFKYITFTEADGLQAYIDSLDTSLVAFDTELTGVRKESVLLGISLYDGHKTPCYISVANPWFEGIPVETCREVLNPFFKKINGLAHNAKFDLLVFKFRGFQEINVVADSLLAVHIYNPDLLKKLEVRVREDLKYDKKDFATLIGKKWDKIKWDIDTKPRTMKTGVVREPLITLPLMAEYSAEDTYYTRKLWDYYAPKLENENLRKIHDKIEIPLVYIIRDMEYKGVNIDKEVFAELDVELDEGIVRLKQEIYEQAGCEFNLKSPKQVGEVLFDRLGLPVIGTTKGGGRSCDGSTMDALAAMGYRIAEDIAEYNTLKILSQNFVKPIPLLVNDDGRLRCNLQTEGARTGRFSCIEENQEIMIPGGVKKIKDIKVGDLVYCYDNEGNLRIRKVLNVFDNGIQNVVKVKWQSSGNKNRTGTLICTPDHLLAAKRGGWIRAEKAVDEKLYHLFRNSTHVENGNIRPRLYGTNSLMKLEQQVIKTEHLGGSDKDHVHHKDENTANNNPRNLKILSHEEHSKLHGLERAERGEIKTEHLAKYRGLHALSGEDHPGYISNTRYSLLKMLLVAGGRPTYVPMDFDTYRNKCALLDIPLKEVCKRFNSQHLFLTRGFVKRSYASSLSTSHIQKMLNVGFYRSNEITEYYGCTNHVCLSVKPSGKARVYDLEVEEHHNFIASEICVHNCTKPNLQNQPNNEDYPVRMGFIPAEGRKLLVLDWSQIELRMLAHCSRDANLMQAFFDDLDIHQAVADRLGIPRKFAKCVSPDSFIVSYGKLKRIGALSENREDDTFVDIHESVYLGNSKSVNASQFYSNGIDNRIVIISKRNILICSEKHQVKLQNGKLKQARLIDKKDVLWEEPLPYIQFNEHYPEHKFNPFDYEGEKIASIRLNDDWAYFAGAYMGDGCYNEKVITFTADDKNKAWTKSLAASVQKVGLTLRNNSLNTYCKGSTSFIQLMKELDLMKKGSKTFKVPDWAYTNKRLCYSFLAGLIDTDGTIGDVSKRNAHGCSVTTKSVEFAHDIVMLLKLINFDYGIEVCWNKTYERNYYRIHIRSTSIRSLHGWGVLRHPEKKKRLKVFANRTDQRKNPVKENKVQYVGEHGKGVLVDITVDSKEHLYWCNGLITHNTINFGIVYGMGADKLGMSLGISKREAQLIINSYYKAYPGYVEWKLIVEEDCRKHAYIKNIFGRIRRFPEINDFSNKGRYYGALRRAVNTIIQGSSADLMKIGMKKITNHYTKEALKADLLLVVHDEFVIEVDEYVKGRLYHMEQVFDDTKYLMENLTKLRVPVKAEGKIVDRWYQMKDDTFESLIAIKEFDILDMLAYGII